MVKAYIRPRQNAIPADTAGVSELLPSAFVHLRCSYNSPLLSLLVRKVTRQIITITEVADPVCMAVAVSLRTRLYTDNMRSVANMRKRCEPLSSLEGTPKLM